MTFLKQLQQPTEPITVAEQMVPSVLLVTWEQFNSLLSDSIQSWKMASEVEEDPKAALRLGTLIAAALAAKCLSDLALSAAKNLRSSINTKEKEKSNDR